MPSSPVTVTEFVGRYGERLKLEWLAGQGGAERQIVPAGKDISRTSLIGHLNFIYPHRIQVLGESEFRYLENLGKNSYEDALANLFVDHSVAVIICDGLSTPPEFRQWAQASDTPLLGSLLSTDRLIDYASYYLTSLLADKITVHGVFMEVMGIGVLLSGESAIGKSELALELISRGHRLVADDAPEFIRTSPDTLYGTCPQMLRDYLEVRGLGILNVRAMFGDSAVKKGKNLRLIVTLVPSTEEELNSIDRLHGSRSTRQLLEVEIAEVRLPVAPGRNLAVLVEAAARSQTLYYNGYDAAEDFIQRQRNHLDPDHS